MRRISSIYLGIMLMGILMIPVAHAALTPGAGYTITIQKVNSNGTVSDYSTVSATADGNGKLAFTASSIPTKDDCNFIVILIKDGSGTTVRKGVVPAPAASSTNELGVNDLSSAQTEAVVTALSLIGSDDPIAAAYLLTLLRSEGASAYAADFASMGKSCIVEDANGFEGTLTGAGVTAQQMSNFKSALIYNSTAGKKTIAYLMAQFKSAVDNATTAAEAQEIMQKAGGYMGDVFLDAAEAAGIDANLILAAHDAAGDVAQTTAGWTALQAPAALNTLRSMNQSMTSFNRRIAAVKVKSEYTNALTTLNASGAQISRFNTAVGTMITSMENIDATYADFFNNPDAYCTANSTNFNAVQSAINTLFQTAFTTFQTAIASTNPEISDMKDAVAAGFGIPVGQLPGNFGTYYDFSGNSRNWPIPQTVMVSWLAGILDAGGSFTYTRPGTIGVDLPVPANMLWMGSCDNNQYFDPGSCTGNGGTWTPGRRTYPGGMPAEFAAYMKLQDDLQIAEMTRYLIYDAVNGPYGGNPTRAQEKAAKVAFLAKLEMIAGWIAGTTDGTTPITTAQKKAIVKLLMQPSMD